jgi:ribosomal protein L22
VFTAAKDALASRAAHVWADKLIARYGKVQELRIDSRKKTVEISCLLEGEPTTITIKIVNYVVEAERGKVFIRATDFSCTRPWLHKLLLDFGHKHRIELPPWAAAAL